jgi:hypothetical protein
MANFAFPNLLAAPAGTTVTIPAEGDVAKLVLALNKSRQQYKARYGLEFEYTYDPDKRVVLATVSANPNPVKLVATTPKPAKEKKAKYKRGEAGASMSIERALWRNAYLRAFDVVPSQSYVQNGAVHHGAKCAAMADEAVAEYRKFVARHQLAPPAEEEQ